MKIFVVDDHVIFREGLTAIIQREPDIQLVGVAGTVKDTVEMVSITKPDVVLMDFSLPDGTGADATVRILEKYPDCKIIFLTISEHDENLLAAIRSGAKGYLIKNMSPAKLVSAIRSVYQGESAISRSMTLRLMEEFSRKVAPAPSKSSAFGNLSPRETDVLRAVAEGLSNQEIADRLFLSENTVKYHVHSILEKLDLKNRKAAAKYAKDNGLKEE
jgi:DNA-binding NarL/FixJ family response regulator